MEKKKISRIVSLFLAFLLIAPFMSSCGNDQADKNDKDTDQNTNDTQTDLEDDPFSNFDYKGKTLVISNSIGIDESISSNKFIQGPDEYINEPVQDAVFDRNLDVMKRLNINIEYNKTEYDYDEVAGNIRTMINSGDTSTHLIINDIWGLAPITPEGLFHNANDAEYFDFSQPWWYDDFMNDISIKSELRFIVASDYFMDILRSTHFVLMNKDMYNDHFGNADKIYDEVNNREWTMDKLLEYIDDLYLDVNSDGLYDKYDKYGLLSTSVWGSCIPLAIGGDPGFIERDDAGYPKITLNNERAVLLFEKIDKVLNNKSSTIMIGERELERYVDDGEDINIFTDNRALFWTGNTFSMLEKDIRNSDTEFAVLPYPMLDENQKDYVSTPHDTVECGFIPVTISFDDLNFVSAFLEVMSRETYKQILPVYYESTLKVRYTRDQKSAQMIDIIHDHYGNSFALAYSYGLNGIFLRGTFCLPIMNGGGGSFTSAYKSLERSANKILSIMIDNCEAMYQSSYANKKQN